MEFSIFDLKLIIQRKVRDRKKAERLFKRFYEITLSPTIRFQNLKGNNISEEEIQQRVLLNKSTTDIIGVTKLKNVVFTE